MREANFEKADSLDRIGEEKPKPADTLSWDVLKAYQKNDAVEAERLYSLMQEELKKEKPPRTFPVDIGIFWRLINSGDIEDAERVLQRPIDPKAKREVVQARSSAIGFAAILRGRFHDARKHFASARDKASTDDDFGMSTEPFLIPPANELQGLRNRVASEDSTAGEGPGPETLLRAQFRLYKLAMLNCRLGNTAEALSQALKIETLPAPAYWRPAMQALATNVRTFADVQRGDVAQAVKRIESIPIDVPLDLRGTPAHRIEETLWRGELLYRAGRYDEALPYFENPSEQNQEAWPFFKLRAAQIYDRKGDAKKAASLYAEFLRYWKNPDPELTPLVLQAQSALAALQRKRD
ncbi:MAG TPA: hypothetical protein VM100_04395 [Longimicrobiales bacterium]|nr:hypothetical protein [Longimicrobiales bacterium]